MYLRHTTRRKDGKTHKYWYVFGEPMFTLSRFAGEGVPLILTFSFPLRGEGINVTGLPNVVATFDPRCRKFQHFSILTAEVGLTTTIFCSWRRLKGLSHHQGLNPKSRRTGASKESQIRTDGVNSFEDVENISGDHRVFNGMGHPAPFDGQARGAH